MFAVVGRDIQPAVADGEINLAIGTHAQAMQVVTKETGADAIAGAEGLFDISASCSLDILQQIKIRNAGIPDFAAPSEQAGAKPIFGSIVAITEDRRLV